MTNAFQILAFIGVAVLVISVVVIEISDRREKHHHTVEHK